MRILPNVIKCDCGRTLCDLCEDKAARILMKNQINGNELKVCEECHEEIWGGTSN